MNQFRLISFPALLIVLGNSAAGGGNTADSVGPDIIASRISDVANYTCFLPGSNPPIAQACLDPIDGTKIDAIAVGSAACNVGTEPIAYEQFTTHHPVIRGGMFRLLNGRFEQIGTSWVLHEFFATNESGQCAQMCTTPDEGGYALNPGCSNLDSGLLNGAWSQVSPASTINAFEGTNTGFPEGNNGTRPVDFRLQVHYSDLDPALNDGALYFVQSHYVAEDDAAAGNGENNASYRQALVAYNATLDTYNVSVTSSAREEQPAISAWKEFDPDVMQTKARVPGEGLFIVSAKVTDLGDGFWRYEYAVENLNSDRSAASFGIPVDDYVTVRNVGFHDVDYHSGEPYSREDWTATREGGGLRWATKSFDGNPNANALRWSTLYNFRFDADICPHERTAWIELFKPGIPEAISVETIGPENYCDPLDIDHDGTENCSDLCPDTPAGVCRCQGMGLCCVGCDGPCAIEFPRDECVADGYYPDLCGDPTCKSGCPLLDMDNDGDRDLADFASLLRCFSGQIGQPGFASPSQACMNRLDVNDDGAIDLSDYKQLYELGLLVH